MRTVVEPSAASRFGPLVKKCVRSDFIVHGGDFQAKSPSLMTVVLALGI